jgi:hypothetical protein
MRKRGPLLSKLCVGCSILAATPSFAATIEPGQGDLSVNQGQGFKPINSRIDANVGDSVMVGTGGTATVVYGDGCKVNVQPGAVTTIAPLSPCASGSNAQDCGPGHENDPGCGGVDWGGVAFGVITAGAAGAAIWAATQNHGSSPGPASP